jgi:hypothetical protein
MNTAAPLEAVCAVFMLERKSAHAHNRNALKAEMSNDCRMDWNPGCAAARDNTSSRRRQTSLSATPGSFVQEFKRNQLALTSGCCWS